MPILKEYVATGAPVAALFSNIAQNHGVMWGALKGSLALLVRRFVNIVRIWRTETLDELYKVNEENQESIDNITRKYQDIFDKSDAEKAKELSEEVIKFCDEKIKEII